MPTTTVSSRRQKVFALIVKHLKGKGMSETEAHKLAVILINYLSEINISTSPNNVLIKRELVNIGYALVNAGNELTE